MPFPWTEGNILTALNLNAAVPRISFNTTNQSISAGVGSWADLNFGGAAGSRYWFVAVLPCDAGGNAINFAISGPNGSNGRAIALTTDNVNNNAFLESALTLNVYSRTTGRGAVLAGTMNTGATAGSFVLLGSVQVGTGTVYSGAYVLWREF